MSRVQRACVALAFLGAVACVTGCGDPPVRPPAPAREVTPDPDPEPDPEPEPDAGSHLPVTGGAFPETQVRFVEGDPRDAERLADVATCGGCHPDVLSTWQGSAHARASFDNPWYRQSADAMRETRGAEASRFCAGCHDPVLLVAGAMDEPIRPDDPRAHAGVTCLVCHGTRAVTLDGAGSYTLRTGAVPLPDVNDPRSVERHVSAVTPRPLRTMELCASCHRGFLGPSMGNPHHLGGIDDVTPWQRSGYAGSPATRLDEPVEPATCQGCHMPAAQSENDDYAADAAGRFTSHRFAGAHTALASATGDDAQLAAVRARLEDTARIDVPVIVADRRGADFRPADGGAVHGGDAVTMDVVVRNMGAGHRFPGGTLDAQDTWIEVEVRDAEGTLLAEAGTRHADGARDDPTAHRLEATLVDAEARPVRTHRVHRFAAKVFDRTLGPRDAALVRYAFDVPEDAALPLSIDARLRHRRHNRALAAAACASQRSARGRAFTAVGRRLGRAPIDACRAQPITELARSRVWVGEGASSRAAEGGATAPTWRRLFDHALAAIGDVQEHLDHARPSLRAALEAAPEGLPRAMVHLQRARLEGRQGRSAEAAEAADAAEAIVGAHPAIARVRGDAFAQVWRWEDAAENYRAAAEGAPLDDSRWAAFARAAGSLGQDDEALAAARRGLARNPRDESMLRSQSLALSHLESDAAAAAQEAYLTHRSPDALPTLILECGRQDPRCALERLPVHVHPLRPATR
ncbi:MAG: multiheme c-type cytochrome [Sandaracinaceae bacterium]